jgi:RNA methyltransferase, TrmH family
MMLTSLQNPLVKQMRKLHRPKERREHNLFLLEGTHLLEEAYAAGYSLHTLCYTSEWQANHSRLWTNLAQNAERAEVVSPEVLQAIATTVNPDGVLATASRRLSTPFGLEQILDQKISLGIALETIQDPGNLGTLIRTAAAAGVDRLWLSADSVDLDHPKVLRASAGQWFRLPMQVSSNLLQDVAACQSAGIQVIGTLPTASLSYWQVDLTKPTLFLLGNEGAGLSTELAALAEMQVRIPLATGVESLNVAIAAALILFEAQRQRSQSISIN